MTDLYFFMSRNVFLEKNSLHFDFSLLMFHRISKIKSNVDVSNDFEKIVLPFVTAFSSPTFSDQHKADISQYLQLQRETPKMASDLHK